MANQDFFGHEVEMEEADAQGRPKQKNKTEENCHGGRSKAWRKFEKAQGKATRAFMRGLGTAGFAVMVGLAVAGVFSLSFWGWVGVFFLFSFFRKAGRSHWKGNCKQATACNCEAHAG